MNGVPGRPGGPTPGVRGTATSQCRPAMRCLTIWFFPVSTRDVSWMYGSNCLNEGACRSRAVVAPDRCPRFWANCSPCGVMVDSGPGGAGGYLERGGRGAACRQTRLGEVRRGVLNVTVAHSTLLEELMAFRKPALLAALRSGAPGNDNSRYPVPGRRDRGRQWNPHRWIPVRPLYLQAWSRVQNRRRHAVPG